MQIIPAPFSTPPFFSYSTPLFCIWTWVIVGKEKTFPLLPRGYFFAKSWATIFQSTKGRRRPQEDPEKKAAGRVRTSHFANIQRVTDDWRKRWNMGALDFFCFGSTLSVQSSSPGERKNFFPGLIFPCQVPKSSPPPPTPPRAVGVRKGLRDASTVNHLEFGTFFGPS